jgi:hypothetical protein
VDAYRAGQSIEECAVLVSVTHFSVRQALRRAEIFAPYRHQTPAPVAPKRGARSEAPKPIGDGELAARIERDQAALHGPRMAALEEHARLYGQRLRPVDRMAA